MLRFKIYGMSTMLKFIVCCILITFSLAQMKSIERKHYHTWEKSVGYSQVVKVKNTLYLSGITSSGRTFNDQLNGIYKSIGKILKDYGASTDNIVSEVIYTKDINALKKAIPERLKHFSKDKYPSSSWVQIDKLFNDDLMIEISIIAVLED